MPFQRIALWGKGDVMAAVTEAVVFVEEVGDGGWWWNAPWVTNVERPSSVDNDTLQLLPTHLVVVEQYLIDPRTQRNKTTASGNSQ